MHTCCLLRTMAWNTEVLMSPILDKTSRVQNVNKLHLWLCHCQTAQRLRKSCCRNYTTSVFGNSKPMPSFSKYGLENQDLSRHVHLSPFHNRNSNVIPRFCSSSVSASVDERIKVNPKNYMEATDDETFEILKSDMLIYENFISTEEEQSLFEEVEPYLKRLRYEESHWDDAIHGYRETERKSWREANRSVLNRVRQLAFPPGTPQLAYTHVLDLSKSGVIKAHIDSVRFCGTTIAGLSLLSPAVMRLVCDTDKSKYGDVLLNPRSLYIMRNRARYDYTHEVLGDADSRFRGKQVPRDRRISVICRNEPSEEDTL